VLSLTVPSDHGTVYTPAQVAELTAVARERGMRAHLDGARVANAVAALGCSPADLTWRAGIDAMSLGATKNGALSTDAIVCFDPTVSEQLVYRVKRAGHVASKMRFQSVQLTEYLTNNLWLRLAGHANAAMTRLAAGLRSLDVEFLNEPDVNMLFARLDPGAADRMAESGLLFYRMSADTIRLVTSFQTTDAEIDEALSRMKIALNP
jgi:threonine aldolase